MTDHGNPADGPTPLIRAAAIAVLLAVQLLIALALCEGVLQAMYHFPKSWYPVPIRYYLQIEYLYRRHVVQVDERFAQYDPQLLYTLRPGRFTSPVGQLPSPVVPPISFLLRPSPGPRWDSPTCIPASTCFLTTSSSTPGLAGGMRAVRPPAR